MAKFYRRALYISPWDCRLAIQIGSVGCRIGRKRGEGARLAIYAPPTH